MIGAEKGLHSHPVNALLDKQVVVTRAAEQAGTLADILRSRGAEPLPYPCIAIEPPDDTTALDDALQSVMRGEFDWLVLTSANTVNVLADRATALLLDLSGVRTAVVGSATAVAARSKLGVKIEVLPEIDDGLALAGRLPLEPGARVLLPQADIALLDLAQALEIRGAEVITVMAYRTVMGSGGVDVPRLLKRREIDAITFTSPSTVRNFLWRLVEEDGCTADLDHVAVGCIGKTTANTAERCGLSVAVLPAISTLAALVQRLEDYFS